jgi:transcription elongation GreA/GreB family factor
MAKDDQKVLLARQAELQGDLMRAKPTDFTEVSNERVGIGSIVKLLESGSSESKEFTILGAWDSDPDNNILSYLTPLGQSLLGKTVGDEVQIDVEGNSQSLKIEGLSRWVDRA